MKLKITMLYNRLVEADVNLLYISSIWVEAIVGLIVYILAYAYTLSRGVCSYVLGSFVSTNS